MDIESARSFIYRNARPLDIARWRFLFENGCREDVLSCLEAYQNPDGGFGHALEPDCWNPNSSPMQTWAASEIIREVSLGDAAHPIIRGMLAYLESTAAFDGHIWANTIPSNDEHPHAPWWDYSPSREVTYNPTASLAGFIIKDADHSSALYAAAVRIAKEAYEYFAANQPLDSMHTVSCYVELFEYLRECGADIGIDIGAFELQLKEQLKHVLTQDTSVWDKEYVCKPSLFIHSRQSVFYPEYMALCGYECEFISRSQKADGTWNITWEWGSYPEQWSISKNWWKSDLIIKNVCFYNAVHL